MSTNSQVNCPFCPALCQDLTELCQHMVTEHGGLVVGGRRLLPLETDPDMVTCWCGKICQWLGPPRVFGAPDLPCADPFPTHLEEAGGVEHHVLRLILLRGKITRWEEVIGFALSKYIGTFRSWTDTRKAFYDE